MTLSIETEITDCAGLDLEDMLGKVIKAAMLQEGCPFDVSASLLVTTDEAVREINREQRGIDRETDVLSFPAFEYPSPADFEAVKSDPFAFDPETGELMLGDIVISIDRAVSQAEAYGHTIYRELSFLIAHSVLHLIGYDHERGPEEEKLMFSKQEQILESIGAVR